jgi:RNA recognition motif-containing protein
MPRLFLSNIPYDCQDMELRSWIEEQGFNVDTLRVIRDQVAGVSPAFGYVSLRGAPDDIDVIKLLDGRNLKGRRLQVRKDWRDEYHSR